MQKILIIEDNPVNMELASDLLEVAGFLVLQAANAEEGLALARAEVPHLVLMDLSLPGMDGLTATRLLRADSTTAHIPVVVLTANAMKGDEDRAHEAGAIGYIAKPFDTRHFASHIHAFLEADGDT